MLNGRDTNPHVDDDQCATRRMRVGAWTLEGDRRTSRAINTTERHKKSHHNAESCHTTPAVNPVVTLARSISHRCLVRQSTTHSPACASAPLRLCASAPDPPTLWIPHLWTVVPRSYLPNPVATTVTVMTLPMSSSICVPTAGGEGVREGATPSHQLVSGAASTHRSTAVVAVGGGKGMYIWTGIAAGGWRRRAVERAYTYTYRPRGSPGRRR